MGIFSKKSHGFNSQDSERELNARIKSIRQRSGLADDVIKDYKRGRASKEDVRRELARHDDTFRYVDSED